MGYNAETHLRLVRDRGTPGRSTARDSRAPVKASSTPVVWSPQVQLHHLNPTMSVDLDASSSAKAPVTGRLKRYGGADARGLPDG
jgi:hypothetical protein